MGQGKQKPLWLEPSIRQVFVRKNNCLCSKTVFVRLVEEVSFLRSWSPESALDTKGVQFAQTTTQQGTANKSRQRCPRGAGGQ